MKSFTKILAAVAVAGTVAVGGSAFTAAGMTISPAAESVFVGGSVTQTVEGANLDSIVYTYEAGTGQTGIESVLLTFGGTAAAIDELEGNAVTAVVAGGVWASIADEFRCTVAAEATATTSASTCTPYDTGLGAPELTDYYTGLDSFAVTVASS